GSVGRGGLFGTSVSGPISPLLSCPPGGCPRRTRRCEVAAFQALVETVGTALRIAEPHIDACRTVEAIEIALRAETHRCKADGQHTRAATYDRAAEALAGTLP